MSRRLLLVLVACVALFTASVQNSADAQTRGGRHVPPRPPGHLAVRGHVVFVGGYFYDPHFGPYPWWRPGFYPYAYFPHEGLRASVRVLGAPEEAAVYVDGFYAGIVDDFDGIFQSLPLPPGGHEITLYDEGFRTVRQRVYLSPGSTFKLHLTLERLPAGVASEPPPIAPPVPPPPMESVVPFGTPRRGQPGSSQLPPAVPAAVGFGSLSLRVQPASADVTVDGARWASSVEGQFVLEIAVGSHCIDVAKPGYQRFSTEVHVREGETTPLNVVLAKEKP